jgi:predicted nucleotidyltransferase
MLLSRQVPPLRGEQATESDLDILIELEKPIGFVNFCGLRMHVPSFSECVLR